MVANITGLGLGDKAMQTAATNLSESSLNSIRNYRNLSVLYNTPCILNTAGSNG